jgi:hypothetical protein
MRAVGFLMKISKSIFILIGGVIITSFFLYEIPSPPVNGIRDPNKVPNVAEMRTASLINVEGNDPINLKPKYTNPQETIILLTEDEKLNINKMMKYYQSTMPSQPLELVEKYIMDYLRINLPIEKIEEATKSVSNLIEYERSLTEMDNNYKIINISEVERKKWMDNLKFDLKEKFVQKDGASLYAVIE